MDFLFRIIYTVKIVLQVFEISVFQNGKEHLYTRDEKFSKQSFLPKYEICHITFFDFTPNQRPLYYLFLLNMYKKINYIYPKHVLMSIYMCDTFFSLKVIKLSDIFKIY